MDSRACAGPSDLPAMHAMVAEAWGLAGPAFPCAPGDLTWRMLRNEGVRPERDVRLFCEGGSLRGIAWWYPNGDLDLIVHPASSGAVPDAMIDWGLARHAEAPADARPAALLGWALDADVALSRTLARRAVAPPPPERDAYLAMYRALDAAGPAAPPVALPAGYHVRAVRPEEAGARAALHRRAFGSGRLTDACYARLRGAFGYDPALDLVAVAPDGSPAAFVLCWWDARNGVGLFEPVGTDPAHRQRGLARALGAAALDALRARGARGCAVGALAGDPVTPGLYASLGFGVVARNRAHALA